jgi:uncharacterized lipoprotein YddW (UPF0748 family)
MLRPTISFVAAVVAGFAAIANPLRAAPPEVRGTWLTTTANSAISSPDESARTMKTLRRMGLNTVYVECWKNGYTEFPSPTMKRVIGIDMKVNGAPPELQRDLVNETLIEAHRNELLYIAWFEYGFMAAWKDTQNELRKKKEWITTTRDGTDVGKMNSFVWLNPFHPEVQQFLIDISLDAIRKYDLDGIQLDDRIALPIDLGYDPYTVALYKKETGKEPPEDFRDPAWMKWRAEKISAFSLRYVTELRAVNPNLIISVSPAPFPWSYENYLCDWMSWTQWCYCGGKRWDEYVPQCYRMSGDATVKSIQEQIDQMGSEKVSLVAGIRIVGDGPDMPWEGLKQSLDFTRQQEIAGHCLWFSRGVLEVFPKQLEAYYDVAGKGHANNPFKPRDWRRPPIVAKQNGDAFVAQVDRKARFRVIVKRDGRWVETMSRDFDAGAHTFVEPGAEAVELLVDRRP